MTWMRPGLVFVCLLSLAVCLVCHAADEPAAAVATSAVLEDHYPERHVPFPHGVTGIPDLIYYSPAGYRPLTLDLYLPAAAKRSTKAALPLVIYIHGGGWSAGHSRQAGAFEDFPKVLASLAARGYAVAALNYRLSAEARFPAPIQDVKSGIRWLHAHASSYGIDPVRTAIWGGSAGGHLAALAATSCNVPALEPVSDTSPGAKTPPPPAGNECVQSAVIWYGVFDFAPIATQPPIRQLLGCVVEACSEQLVQEASPVTYVKPQSPPMLLIAGTDDKVVNPDQSRQFDQALQKAGASVKLMMLPGVGHSFVGPSIEATRPATLSALKATFEFFDATIGPASR